MIAESCINPALVGRWMRHASSNLVGEYVRSIRNTRGEHWVELRLVWQGPDTGFAPGGIFSLLVDGLTMLPDVRDMLSAPRAAQLEEGA